MLDICTPPAWRASAAQALEGLKDLGDAARDLENYVLFKLDEKGVPVSEIVHHLALGDKRLQMSNTGRRRSLRDRRPDV